MPARNFITSAPDSEGLPSVAGVRFAMIADFPGYAIGSDGSVWNQWKLGGCVRRLGDVWRKLKVARTGYGRNYRGVAIRSVNDCCRRLYQVHRLVLTAFVGPCPSGMQGCHGNGDPTDNAIENLRWDTPGGNTADKFKHDTVAYGTRQPNAKLTPSVVTELRLRRRAGESTASLAVIAGVCDRTLRRALRGDTWKRV